MADVVPVVAIPGPLAGDHAGLFRQIHQAAQGRNALTKENVKFGNAEGGSHFVFGHLHLGPNPIFLGALFQGLNAANIEPHGGIELEGVPPGSGFGVAVGNADFLPQLVKENHRALGFADAAGNFPQRLAHQAGLQTHVGIAHFPFNFRPGHQRRHRVHHHHIDGRRPHQLINHFEAHFSGIRLGDEQFVNVHPQRLGIERIEGVFRIHKGRHPTRFLYLGDGMEGDGGFPGTLWAIDFNHAAFGQTTPQGQIQGERPGRDGFDLHPAGFAQTHNRPFAIVALNLVEYQGEGFLFFGNVAVFRCHNCLRE